MLAITEGFILIEKRPSSPLSLKIAYEVIEQPPVDYGYDHLRVTVVAVELMREGAETLLGATQD